MWLVVICVLAGCEAATTFTCAADAECRRGDVTGTCEVGGACSFRDTECRSGSRYDTSAGGLAGTCVVGDCTRAWHAGTIRFGAPTVLAINSTVSDRDPFVTADGLSLFFGSQRNGGTGVDVYQASRASTTADWATPVRVDALSSGVEDTKVSMTTDGLDLTLTSERSGHGGVDVFESTRTSPTAIFDTPSVATMENVNTPGNEYDALMTGSGLHLYLAPSTPSPQHIAIATRSARAMAFAAPTEITELTSGTGEADPALSDDETIIVFTSLRPGSAQGSNLWFATRASTSVPFGVAAPVPDVDSDLNEGDAFLTADACTLYFAHDALGDTTDNWDLVRADALGD